MTRFPDIVAKLPEADVAFTGADVRLLRGPTASAIFVEALEDMEVPSHTHAAQWGVVVDGEMRLTIGRRTATYRRGDEYLIPAGTPHAAALRAGTRVIDFFDDRDRYRPRPGPPRKTT
ncbi:MAG: cupin domain-containing protein [Methanobacteriota archaeon]